MTDCSVLSSHALFLVSVLVGFELEDGRANGHDEDAGEVGEEDLGERVPVDESFLGHRVQLSLVGEAAGVHGNASDYEV